MLVARRYVELPVAASSLAMRAEGNTGAFQAQQVALWRITATKGLKRRYILNFPQINER